MKIQEMFDELGLSPETVSQLQSDIQLHNFQHPQRLLREIKLDRDIETLLLTHTPMIGRAIAKERGRLYLDDEGQYPLSWEENAMRYGVAQIAGFYNAAHLFNL